MERQIVITDKGTKTAAVMIGLYGLAGLVNDPQWFLLSFPLLAFAMLGGSKVARIIALAGTVSLGIFSAIICIKGALNPAHQAPVWFLAYFAAAAVYWIVAAILLGRAVRCRQTA